MIKRMVVFDEQSLKDLEMIAKYYCLNNSECVRLSLRELAKDVTDLLLERYSSEAIPNKEQVNTRGTD